MRLRAAREQGGADEIANRPNTAQTRRYDLDWLRVLAIALIFLFHSSRPLDNSEAGRG